MKTKRMPYQNTRIAVQGKYFQDFTLPTGSPDVKELFAISKYLSHGPRDRAMLEESIVTLFKEAFDINIKTCTEGEWTERITIKGGAIKQWQSLIV